jgi:hypothetical protein
MVAYYTVFAPRDTNGGAPVQGGLRGGGIFSIPLPPECGGGSVQPPPDGGAKDSGASTGTDAGACAGGSGGAACAGGSAVPNQCFSDAMCGGHLYRVDCQCNGVCTCMDNGVPTSMFGFAACPPPNIKTACGYPVN